MQRKSPSTYQSRNRLRARPALEGLETRLAPANVFVVPVGTLGGNGTFFYTLQDAISHAGPGGTVTIEPGASPDQNQPDLILDNGMTIQGDPNVPLSILPSCSLQVNGANDTFTNLNLSSIQLGTVPGSVFSSGCTISKCLIGNVTQFSTTLTFTQNTVTGKAFFDCDGTLTTQDVISNNTFTTLASTMLSITNAFGTVVTQNRFFGHGGGQTAISLVDCQGSASTPATIVSNNAITINGGIFPPAIGIFVLEVVGGASNVEILNNRINTTGIGLEMSKLDQTPTGFTALVQGNDFATNTIGVRILGSGNLNNGIGVIDMGGGSLGSLGGNNFHDYGATGTINNGAIVVTNSGAGVVTAQGSIFPSGVSPHTLCFGPVLLSALTDKEAFVQALYNDLLGRTGSLSEIDGWVTLLNAQSQAAVVNGILRSPESLGRIVDSFYLRFLGRQSDPGGRAGWISFLQNGGTEENLETNFLTSREYISHIGTDFVQSLYLNILGRTGSTLELAGWNNNIQSLGLAGIASAFTHSPENRANTITSYFLTFLHRPPTDTELPVEVGSPQDLLSVEGALLSTPEFFAIG
jgi:hypothetical protein